ncbi:hypothetical protein ElyMa_003882400 [Elysia marginata]|uniref:SEA domain-containing protein n=1 Tax=Elysia marginata TaxID=1093978 RepID=A0AAV4FP53_9GAST|nr:hypothetical protein ElyMa_003882400 [Elysia marginata]
MTAQSHVLTASAAARTTTPSTKPTTTTTTTTTTNAFFTAAFSNVFVGLLVISLTVFPATNGLHLSSSEAISSLSHVQSQTSPPTNSTMDFLLRTLEGLDKSLRFFQSEFKNINLDAVIGTRIVQGKPIMD